MLKNKECTKEKLLCALKELILENGFEKTGINKVAAKANVSKVLIYRYFGSFDQFIEELIFKNDYWINYEIIPPKISELNTFLKNIFKNEIVQHIGRYF